MNAKEARDITEKACENHVGIEDILEFVYKRIKESASKGEQKLVNPFDSKIMSFDKRSRVIKALKEQGYKYTAQRGNQWDYDPEYISW